MAKADRVELFCQEIIHGKSQRQAYYTAYPNSRKWKPETVDCKASVLANDDKVLARLAELRRQAEANNQISRDDILRELKNIGFAKITDYAEIKGPLVSVKPTDSIPAEKIGVISSIEQGNFGIKVKLNDKLKALEMLIKILGYDRPDENGNGELKRLIEGLKDE